MSLDGYVAGPDQSLENQIGVVESPHVRHIRYRVGRA